MKKSTIIQIALAAFTIGSIIFMLLAFNSGMLKAINSDSTGNTLSSGNATGTTSAEDKTEFTGIILQGTWNVTITQSDIHSIHPQFTGDQDPNTIGIEIDSNKTLLLTNPVKNNPVSIELTTPSLEFIDSRGNSDINISSLSGDYFYIYGMENSSFALKNTSFDLMLFDLKNSVATVDSKSGIFQGEIADQSILRYKGNPDTSTLSVSEDSILEEFDF